MTQQDDIPQRVLTAEHHLNELMRLTQPWPNATIPCATVRSHVEQALSKLRAPVADETQALHDHDLWFQEYGQTLGAFYNNLTIHTRAAWVAASRQYAALASAPVAGEAIAWLSDAGLESLRRFGQASVVGSGARSDSSEFKHPLYAAPQASEAVRDAALKRACSLREVTCKKCGLQVISSCRGDGCPVKDRYADLRALSAQPGARK